MPWQPDMASDEPIFRQIARHFETSIIRGDLPPGTPLPPQRKLARQFNVNRSTITQAYDELHSLGLVQSHQGKGTWVSENMWGVSYRRIPNWHQYTSGGAFLPSRPLAKLIREASSYPGVINLAEGGLSPELMPSEDIERLLRQISLPPSLSYANPRGDGELRETLAVHWAKEHNLYVDPDEILITTGSQQALHLITQCLLSPGDAIAMEGPSFAYSLPLFTSAGLRLFRLPLDDQGLLPEEVISLHRKHKIRMIFTNPTYQNPTGTVLGGARRKRLLAICEELRLPIVEDDAYGSLTLIGSGKPPRPLKAMDMGGSVLYIGSLSKTLAPGLRIGWLAGPKSVVERLADAKHVMDSGTGIISQKLAQAYLSSQICQQRLDELTVALTERRDCMLEALEKNLMELADWTRPKGSFYVWCRLRQSINEADLLELGIKHGVIFSPGGIYGAERGYVRLTYAQANRRDITEGVRRLRAALVEANPVFR
ncbi:PLP-dependent aminotransferase family protein [Brevibacillus massiliensis]|jgi:DNA-binding transcriptional MocR family regulator|uniref:aminotransferase-like domain-containing protein n=2 Tax=Brevibacillus massiliensis TaxID=1118054 RepID=UPI0002FE1C4C|nr:PLP-dependent aminotransferase family protein [Brevibacillus massiliensis]